MAIVRALLLAAAVAGCGGPAPFDRPTPADFTSSLASYGQLFTPRPAPPDAADWHLGVPNGLYPAPVAYATYGEVTCVDPSKHDNCSHGLAQPGQTLAIWVIGFVDTPAAKGCPMWATVDAKTGDFINGTSLPC
jgi:hypothetical protein